MGLDAAAFQPSLVLHLCMKLRGAAFFEVDWQCGPIGLLFPRLLFSRLDVSVRFFTD